MSLVACLFLFVSIVGPLHVMTVHAAPQTVVSLTFDDGLANQISAQSLLDSHGMKGTFYVNSGRLNTSGYMTTAQVQAIQAAGHEIGGHTVDHKDLTTLSNAALNRQVCNDRNALSAAGIVTTSFAYPFGSFNNAAKQAVKSCGYTNARTVGDVSCSGCSVSESIPPKDAYAVRTPDSIKATTSLATMQSYVTKAESTGGWVVLVMHNVCAGCDTYAVTQAQLDQFMTWLQSRSGRGTVVKTVAEAMNTPISPPPLPPANGNLLSNASYELDTDQNGVPDCWQRGGYGTNTANISRVSDARTGSWAERLQITSYTNGDAKVASLQQNGACAPAVNQGASYRAGVWYKSSQPVKLVAYYMTSSGTWQYWDESPSMPISTTYRNATWSTPVVPASAVRVGIALSLSAVGTVTMDDFSLSQN